MTAERCRRSRRSRGTWTQQTSKRDNEEGEMPSGCRMPGPQRPAAREARRVHAQPYHGLRGARCRPVRGYVRPVGAAVVRMKPPNQTLRPTAAVEVAFQVKAPGAAAAELVVRRRRETLITRRHLDAI